MDDESVIKIIGFFEMSAVSKLSYVIQFRGSIPRVIESWRGDVVFANDILYESNSSGGIPEVPSFRLTGNLCGSTMVPVFTNWSRPADGRRAELNL